ncbi:MAG TPA: DUF4019 domain-containing protein [Polyangiaceae bacterium]|nr:DUF4019 domain-containing protein [Polyangiaceae bacterium]
MRVISAQRHSVRLPLAWVASVASLLLAVGACQPQPLATPDAEAINSESPAATQAPSPSPEEAAQVDARKGARDWLALVDGGQYDASWDAAAPVFQSSTDKQRWNQALQGARGPLGPLGTRQFRAAEYKTSIAGAPEGKYVVVYYDSAFAQKAGAREIVTLRQQADESWKVAGYFVQ